MMLVKFMFKVGEVLLLLISQLMAKVHVGFLLCLQLTSQLNLFIYQLRNSCVYVDDSLLDRLIILLFCLELIIKHEDSLAQIMHLITVKSVCLDLSLVNLVLVLVELALHRSKLQTVL